jgi:hypothetical protein
MVDYGQIAGGAGLIAIGLATPIPVIDEALGAIIGIPMILNGLGAEEGAKKLEENT